MRAAALLFIACFLDAQVCAPCHQRIYDSFRRTGMGRSFALAADSNAREAAYYHPASEQRFRIYQRSGRWYQRREAISDAGVVEMSIDYVLGSGNHARTYLHRNPDGRLVELPLGWYSENGGTWSMNPGYDRPDHMDFRRKLDEECLFCHTAYPAAASAAPQAVDCQRCHGDAAAHLKNRGAILNPARLSSARQLEICLQCHLESTSRRLPYAIRRYGRGFFSYQPGEPLENYILHFDHATGAGYDDKFEIDSAGYRLLRSACFRKSNRALTCTTCHDPHQEQHGAEAVAHYNAVCKNCHASAHRKEENCIGCHMPRRRTEDVVHVLMTDHAIERDPPPPTRPDRPGYHGEVVLLYPRELPDTPDAALYRALAQVKDGSNLAAGIPRLRQAIKTYSPHQPEFYHELAKAYAAAGNAQAAIPWFDEAFRRDPTLAANPPALVGLGAAYLAVGHASEAVSTLRRAVTLDPDLPEARIDLANALSRQGRTAEAIDSLRAAIRLQPASAAAHNNIAAILDAQGDFSQARYHFERAIHFHPNDAVSHYNYGRALAARKLYAEAEPHLARALELDPLRADAAVTLGLTQANQGHPDRAIDSYRRALRIQPDLAIAHFNLARSLLTRGDKAEAAQHLEQAIQANPHDYESHLYLGKIQLDEHRYESAIMNLETASQSPQPDVRKAALEALRTARSAK